MRTDDQWFKPGDKVMLVDPSVASRATVSPNGNRAPKFGEVHCVEDFWEGPSFNVVMLVGFGGWKYDSIGRPIGWRATAFRKVEEIKLCVAAAQHAKQPEHAEVNVAGQPRDTTP